MMIMTENAKCLSTPVLQNLALSLATYQKMRNKNEKYRKKGKKKISICKNSLRRHLFKNQVTYTFLNLSQHYSKI